MAQNQSYLAFISYTYYVTHFQQVCHSSSVCPNGMKNETKCSKVTFVLNTHFDSSI